MATIIRELWGLQPSFLRSVKKRKNLWEVIEHLPNRGIGMLVTEKDWWEKGWTECHWKLTRVEITDDLQQRKAFGIKTVHGVTFPEERQIKRPRHEYQIYRTVQQQRALEDKMHVEYQSTTADKSDSA
ncbi:hypothetical protein HK104_003931 [Borealophlyctis nickersoniae]|nr:hypothetical protein HK104_003931 [Borealophlyctis nickersoniae]